MDIYKIQAQLSMAKNIDTTMVNDGVTDAKWAVV